MTGQPLQFDQRFKTTAAISPAKDLKSYDPKLVNATRTLVAQTFFGTMLKQASESPFKSDLFDGGRGGQAFNSMLDQHLAEHMTRGAGSKLVHSIVRSIARKKAVAEAYKKQSKSGSKSSASSLLRAALATDDAHGRRQ
jgi:Rod binding domain-containing protein